MKNFMIGCNYWASNAGMYMWRNFDENVVNNDFALLSANGVDTIRIFPLWPDFQPIKNAFGLDTDFNVRVGDAPITTPAGLDGKMLARFGKVLDLAEKYSLKVIVSLITGWMSGRLFMPEFLVNEGLLTSPKALVWEMKFIKEFIPNFKDRECIIAWESGNECNCLEGWPFRPGINSEQAELWFASINNTIRSVDNSRPVYSGMHGLGINKTWDLRANGLYVDMLTTHPYPLFTPYCAIEKLTTMRSALHSAAESAFYADVGEKPCLVEEVGVLGPMVIGDESAAEYVEQSIFTSYQYGATGYLWWCGFDQDKFDFSPYDGSGLEQNLGLATIDGKPKKVLLSMKKMHEDLSKIQQLPTFEKHAVVILPDGENGWANAYASFCLAAQAGYSVEFACVTQPLKDSDFYIIPCLQGDLNLKYREQLYEKIKNGAKLLVSYNGGHLGWFEKFTGITTAGREGVSKEKKFTFNGKDLSISCKASLMIKPETAEVVIESDGDIILTKNTIEKGAVYFLNARLEGHYVESYKPYESGLHEIYSLFLDGAKRPLAVNSDLCCVTYHRLDENKVAVLICSFDEDKKLEYSLFDGYEIESTKFCEVDDKTITFNERYAYIVCNRK